MPASRKEKLIAFFIVLFLGILMFAGSTPAHAQAQQENTMTILCRPSADINRMLKQYDNKVVGHAQVRNQPGVFALITIDKEGDMVVSIHNSALGRSCIVMALPGYQKLDKPQPLPSDGKSDL